MHDRIWIAQKGTDPWEVCFSEPFVELKREAGFRVDGPFTLEKES